MSYSPPAVTFDWRLTQDSARVFAIHRAARDKAPPGMVRVDSLEHFAQQCGQQGEMLGCYLDTGEMIAYGVIALRSPTFDHLADMLAAQRGRFCVLDGAASLPEWRGFNLHHEAIARRIAYAAQRGLTQVGTTVAPSNIRSVRGLMRSGLAIRGFARMYGGQARLVLCRDGLLPPRVYGRELSVAISDIEAHQDALAAGLLGYACRQDEFGGWLIDYGAYL